MNFARAAFIAILSANLGGCSLISVFYSANASRSQADTYLFPASFSGEIDAHTSNGRVRCDFGVDTSGKRSTHRLQGRIGQGGTLVKLNTGNGSIDILGCDLPFEHRPFEHRQKTKAAPAAAGDEVWKL